MGPRKAQAMTHLRGFMIGLLALQLWASPAMAQVSGEGTVALAPAAEEGLATSPRPRLRPDAAAPDTAPPPVAETQTAPAPQPSTKPAKPPRDPSKGAVTNLPIPRFVSLKGNEGNARRGPSLTHRIDWVFTKSGMPLRVTAEHENWRRVEDAEGMGGWVHYALLSGVRTALVTAEMADFRMKPSIGAGVAFQAERGVVGRVLECDPDWCRLNIQGEKGWVQKTALWGVDPGEIIE
jgi:SH3-like domain-containing protein